jgi:hypothetical protein
VECITEGAIPMGSASTGLTTSNLSQSGTVLTCGDSVASSKGAMFGGPLFLSAAKSIARLNSTTSTNSAYIQLDDMGHACYVAKESSVAGNFATNSIAYAMLLGTGSAPTIQGYYRAITLNSYTFVWAIKDENGNWELQMPAM